MKALQRGNFAAAVAIVFLSALPLHAAFILAPKTSFGGGDGWLAPADAAHLQGANLQRGLSYNRANNHLYLVDRNGGNNIRILDGTSGNLLGSLDMTGVTGGTFPVNMIDVSDDGIIYAANLTTDTDTTPFKVYRWANEAAMPTVAFDSSVTAITAGADTRIGDTLAVIGAGSGTRIATGGNVATAAGDPADNSFVVLTTTDGLAFSGAAQDFSGTEPANGSFRLGIDFVDADTVIGRQATGTNATVADFAGGAATVAALTELINSSETALAVDRVNKLLATVQFNTSDVRLYNIADPDNPTLLDTKNLIVGAPVANGNGVGGLEFGNGMLYVLNTNNGIQAFAVVPEPASWLLAANVGMLVSGLLRRRG
jgi:hypothetical protein